MYKHTLFTEGKVDVSQIKLEPNFRKVKIGTFILLSWLLMEIIILLIAPEGEKLAAVIMPSIILVIILLLYIIMIKSYLNYKKCLNKVLKTYSKKQILDNIKYGTRFIYKEPVSNNKVYFTGKFIIIPGVVIITYNEISQIYAQIISTKYEEVNTLYFKLLDNRHFSLCNYITDAEVVLYLDSCSLSNQNIILGSTREHNAMHKERVKQYRSFNS